MEVANGQRAVRGPEANRMAVAAAKGLRKLGTGGSDAHDPRYVGVCYTEFKGVIRSSQDFLRALKRGEFRAVTQHGLARELRSRLAPPPVSRKLCGDQLQLPRWADLDTNDVAGHFEVDGECGTTSGPGRPLH